jgi:chorismate mutase
VSGDPAARLAEIRSEIDRIDSELLKLLEAGAAKAALGRPVHDPEREAQLLTRISAHGAGALSPEDLRALWELLMAATRRAESQR